MGVPSVPPVSAPPSVPAVSARQCPVSAFPVSAFLHFFIINLLSSSHSHQVQQIIKRIQTRNYGTFLPALQVSKMVASKQERSIWQLQ